MTDMLKILILEDEPEECAAFQRYVDATENVTIVACCDNPNKALTAANNFAPDAIIIDLELHKGSGNGLQFLSEVKKLSLPTAPYLLVTTNNSSHTTHEAARALGADFILTKYETDYSAQYVVDFLKMMYSTFHKEVNFLSTNEPVTTPAEEISNDTPSDVTSDITGKNSLEYDILEYVHEQLHLVGVSPKNIGYKYLTDAILIKAENCDANIFAIIAPRYKKPDSSIERSMQYALNRAWRTNDPEELLEHYTARIHSERGVPTIMEFVYYYATKVRTHFKIQ